MARSGQHENKKRQFAKVKSKDVMGYSYNIVFEFRYLPKNDNIVN